MRALCEQAHARMGSPLTDVIDKIVFDVKLLSFGKSNSSSRSREPILLDVVSYNVTRLPPFELARNRFFRFTKGTKPDCIFYLIEWRRRRPLYRVGLHFCDVKIPAWIFTIFVKCVPIVFVPRIFIQRVSWSSATPNNHGSHEYKLWPLKEKIIPRLSLEMDPLYSGKWNYATTKKKKDLFEWIF